MSKSGTLIKNSKDVRDLRLDDEWVQQFKKNYWIGLGDTSQIRVVNPFHHKTKFDIENPHIHLLDLMRRQENFALTCKFVFSKILPPYQLAVMRELWIRPFPMLMGSRGLGKSFLLSMYCMLRACFTQGSKIVVTGAAFRQSKIIYDYCVDIWNKAPVLRSMFPGKNNGPKRDVDRCYIRLGESLITFIPLGDGQKIRGLRANIVIGDEFASIPLEIFEVVVKGFGVVSMDPIEKMQAAAEIEALKELGLWHQGDNETPTDLTSNQTVISGTAYYAFNHFYSYWKRYKTIIESKGDPQKLAEVFPGKIPEDFNWRDFSIIRIPVEMVGKAYFDEKAIGLMQATSDALTFMMECGACFATDSNGFYKRSLIEKCVVGKAGDRAITWGCGEVLFSAVLRGNPFRKYVIAVDPASQVDNFSISILELHPDHRRIVHGWTSTAARYKARKDRGLTQAATFYAYTARKIRELHRAFPAERIAIDTQGGGLQIMEALNDPSNMLEGEKPLHPYIDENDKKPTDDLPGLHILDPVSFASAEWVSFANHGMRKDFEDKVLLFPEFDSAVVGLAMEADIASGRVVYDEENVAEKLYDTLEDCVMEIEQLKDELATIQYTQTGVSNRDHWDTPETKMPGGKKGRQRKDRYSSLLMANASARRLAMVEAPLVDNTIGGFARDIGMRRNEGPNDGRMWYGAGWLQGSEGSVSGAIVVRGN